MEILLQALEEYAEEILIPHELPWPEYRALDASITRRWDCFRAALTEQQLHELDAILREEACFRRLEDAAYFRAALSIGLELSRF